MKINYHPVLKFDYSITAFKYQGTCTGPMTFFSTDVRFFSVLKYRFPVAAVSGSVMLFEKELLTLFTL